MENKPKQKWLNLADLTKQDGELVMIVKAEGQTVKSYKTRIVGGKLQSLERTRLGFEPRTDFIWRRSKAERAACESPPDEAVSVEQKFHSWPSHNSFGKESSKSLLVQIVPRLRPATRFFFECATTGTKRATGVPCSVMITSLPATAWASKSGICPGLHQH
jgi:hypothetical protein